MRILAIETSCDETAVALLDITGPRENPEIVVLGNSLFSQSHLHEQYGGVYPNLAKREHQKNLPILLERTLEETRDKILHSAEASRGKQETKVEEGIDYIAVTQGPGLEPALWTGITFAEKLGEEWGKPVVPVDHMAGHIWSVLYMTGNSKSQETNHKQTPRSTLAMPALALLVSGGHTELVLIKDFGQYEILGKTRDDAVGEAFDKVARMLGLGYPGGPAISAMAEIVRNKKPHFAKASRGKQETNLKFPRPMINSNDLDFSYSGLKTAVLYHIKNHPPQTEQELAEIARAFEDSAIEVLIHKTRSALNQHSEVKSLIVGGGVSANTYLQSELKHMLEEFPNIILLTPDKPMSTDNAIMIGISAYIKTYDQLPETREVPIVARGNLSL